MKYVFFLFALVLTVASCRRPGAPYPRICPAKESYRITDTIQVTNCSERFSTQRWVLPDGSTSVNPTAFYVPPSAGSYTFKLYVSDDDFVNEYGAEKVIIVTD